MECGRENCNFGKLCCFGARSRISIHFLHSCLNLVSFYHPFNDGGGGGGGGGGGDNSFVNSN
jgi:hypothetical protein